MAKGGRVHRKSSRAGVLTKLLILLLLVGIGWQLYRLHVRLDFAESERTRLAQQVESQEQANAALEKEIASGGTREQMEELARDELGLVSPGEKVFYDVSN